MPRMLPQYLTKQFAIEYLFRLYENEENFNREREKSKFPFVHLIEKLGKVESLYTFYDLTSNCPGISIITRINDQQKLTVYLKDFLGKQTYERNMEELGKQIVGLREKLVTYVSRLNKLAFEWNLCASWAGDQLFQRDIEKEVQNTFDAAGVTIFNKPTFEQLQELLQKQDISFPVKNYKVNLYSLYFAGGKLQYINKIKHELKDYENELKNLGVKEFPSALRKHAEWWFKHYVYGRSPSDIANTIAAVDKGGGPQPENIRKAILKFSELIDIRPEERTKIILPVT